MIYRKVHINGWTAHFYFAIKHYWIEEIKGKMQSLGAGRKAHGGKRMMFRISDEAQHILDMVDDKSRFINDLIIKATR